MPGLAAIDADEVLKTEEQAREDVLAIARKNVGNMNSYMTLIMLAMSGAMLMRGRKANDQTGMNGKRMG